MSAALPPSLRANPRLAQWLGFDVPGVVEVRSGKVEIGQGILTALAQVAAEELDVSIGRVRMRAASTAESPNEGMTSGSLSMQDSGSALRIACAQARAAFLDAAAAKLGAPREALALRDGEIVAANGHRTSYWELASEGALAGDASGAALPKPARDRTLAGSNAPRLDLADKVFGRARFLHDIDLPGMLHGRVVRPPSPAARLASIDASRARAMAGVVDIVQEGRFLGVVAEREETAVAAAESIRAAARWEESETLPDSAALAEWLRGEPAETSVVDETGAPPVDAVTTLRARFTRPFTAHASLGPSCAIAQWRGDALDVWSHTQGIFNLRADLAAAFGIAPERIVVQHVEGAGCYGHNGADDAAMDAAFLARAAAGRPVRVVWSRADELSWSPFGPAMAIEIEAGLDAAGEVVAWRSEIWSNGHSSRPGRAKVPVLLAAAHRDPALQVPVAINTPLATGGGAERNAVPAYGVGARRIVSHRVLSMPLRTSALRSLGAYANVFAIESMVDAIAAERGEDPLDWRLRHLDDPRARAVLEAAARRFGWRERRAREGIGQGLGFARYKGNAAYCAVAAEIEAGRGIRATRLCIAVDVGFAVNPDGVANQIEGGAIQAASWTLREAVAFDRTRVTSASWEAYPILRFSEVPAVEVEVVQRIDEPSMGAGEASMGPTAAAIGNAVFAALGVRIRDLPITPERVVAAIG